MTGLEPLKPILTALVLPPVPWLLMILLGARWLPRRPPLGRLLIWLGVVLIWLSACQATARWLHERLGLTPPSLTAADIDSLKAQNDGHGAIVVLGGGLVSDPAEPATPELHRAALERLQYGIRLARRTGWPMAFSGGVGWAQQPVGSPSEAETARRIAEQDFGYAMRWTEGASRDTRENARQTLALLYPQGVRRIVIVTHSTHMPRAALEFRRAAPGDVQITLAPVQRLADDDTIVQWLPTSDGFEMVRSGLREWLGQGVANWSASTPVVQTPAIARPEVTAPTSVPTK